WVPAEILRLPAVCLRPDIDPGSQKGQRKAPNWAYTPGTFRSNSSSQTRALPSDGARQSPRGESEPPAATFGPLGIAERLNWLKAKNRRRNTPSQWRISPNVNAIRNSAGKPGGQAPLSESSQACIAIKAIFDGRKPWRSV